MSTMTTFSPSADCLSNTFRYGANQLVGPMTSTCYPSGWTNTSTTYYSPGVCPSNYITGCITANTAGSVTETVATCCPSSFMCASSGGVMGCRSTIMGGLAQLMTVMDADFASPSTTVTETIGGNVNAYGVQIRFQASDLVRLTSASSSTSSTSTQNGAGPTDSVPAPTPTSSSGLSTGAIAGIGVGAALAGLIFLVAVFLGWRYVMKKRRTAILAQDRNQTMQTYNGNEMAHAGSRANPSGLHEVQAGVKYKEPHETEGLMRSELPEQSEERTHELYGEGR